MSQPTPPAYTDADVELVARAIYTDDFPQGPAGKLINEVYPEYHQNARAALAALAAAGRLLPAEVKP